MGKKGLVFGIQHFSIHDGEGVRSNVFLKGCPLSCLWCHNPEGITKNVGIQYIKNKCRNCGKCGFIFRDMSKLHEKSAEQIRGYVKLCPYGALEQIGNWMSAQEVVEEVLEDLHFFQESHGGITLSGGEPMFQWEFALEILKESKAAGLPTAMETSGFAPLEAYLNVLPYVDEFLWDYKETDHEKHWEFTGVGNEQILGNLDALYAKGAKIILRCPIIPGLNDTEEHFQGIAARSQKMSRLLGVELMPYHKFGVAKARRIGKTEQKEYEVRTKEQKKQWERKIRDLGGRVF